MEIPVANAPINAVPYGPVLRVRVRGQRIGGRTFCHHQLLDGK